MTGISITECPFCGGTEFIEAYQSGYASLTAVKSVWRGTNVYHTVCRGCGSIVRTYVKNPEMLIKKSERRG